MIDYLINTNDLIKIFSDFYYVKGKPEKDSSNINKKHTLVELVSKLLDMMKIEKWYFGLHTALKVYGITLKDNAEECLVCTRMPFNRNKIEVLGKKLQIFVFKPQLIDFYNRENGINYSDLEKTFLDFVYLWKLNHIPDHKLFTILGKYKEKVSQEKIIVYSKIYPVEIQKVLNDFYS